VNAYGIPRYREINPGVFTCITFPFLIGVMFGDVGHGMLMLMGALYVVINEKKWMNTKLNEIFKILFNGRYVILLMSLFSIYCGAIYNEFFAIPADAFGSRWYLTSINELVYTHRNTSMPYLFGIDPVWKGAENELLFYNSIKMKMSIVVGVLQMTLGIFLKLLNAIHFRHPLDIFFEFLPQVVFLFSTFGYMCFLIFMKWTVAKPSSPLILIVMINMFLPPTPADGVPIQNLYVYDHVLEKKVEGILVIIALICIPMMLIPKPLIIYFQFKKKKSLRERGLIQGDEMIEGQAIDSFVFSEVIVHQVLETIEFVLGTLSHTASYLRLWALSLAHSELATVFWDMLFGPSMTFAFILEGFSFLPNYVRIIISVFGTLFGFMGWFAATIGIILAMESLSAFLHALRLHWVEFQSKFYKGDGVKFAPLSYEKMLQENFDAGGDV